jgi:hypothetical protein
MITDEQLATALVAKMAGMELKKVDDYTVTQASTGPATRIDPKQFLPGVQQMQQNHQAAIIAAANREAEMAFPLPQAQTVSAPIPQTFTGQSPISVQPQSDPNQLTFDFLDEATTKKSLKQLDLIVDYLYSINNKLDKVLSKRD